MRGRVASVLLLGVSVFAFNETAFADGTAKFFDIQSQSAASAVAEFAHEAGVQILASENVVRAKRTNAVRGELTVSSAIRKLVAGTGIVVASDDGHTIILADEQKKIEQAPEAIRLDSRPRVAAAPVVQNEIETVTVTARRREESLEKVPITVSALSGTDLSDRQVLTQSDLQFSTPGLIIHQSQSRNSQNYAIRGQSIDAYTSSQPSVLSYVNDYQNATVTASAFYDLSSVQVLKGPQGTLFGRNTTGGAVLFTTAKPDLDNFGGFGMIRVGNYDWHEFQGAVNIPLSDEFAIRVAGDVNRRDGYITNMVTGEKLNEDHSDSIRISALWRPNDRFENSLVAQYSNASGTADALEVWSAYAPGQVGPGPDHLPLTTSAADFFSPNLDNIAGPGAYDALRAAFPGAPAGGYLEAAARQRAAGPWKTWLNFSPLRHASHSDFVIDTATYRVSENLQFKNIVGYSQNTNVDGNDADGSPFGISNEIMKAGNWQASDEFQVSGTALDGKLDFITGVYFSNQITTHEYIVSAFDMGPVANAALGFPLTNFIKGSVRDSTEGVFAQATYKLDELLSGLSVTVGGRYSWEQLRFLEEALAGTPPGIVERRSDSNPSWEAGFQYQASDDLMFYITHRGSWRSGGFNVTAPPIPLPAELGGNEFGPETTKDVEIGAKFQGHLGSMPVRLNADAFNQWVGDIQRVAFLLLPGTGETALTVNVPGGAVFRGFEVDGEVFPVDWLQLGGAFSVTDASYGDPHVLTLFGTLVDYDTFADLAKYSGSVYAQVYLPIDPAMGTMTIRGDFYASSPVYISNFGQSVVPETKIPGYGLLNFRFNWENVGQSGLSFAAFAKNALNQPYYAGGIGTGSQTGSNEVVPGQPRFYGVEIGYKF